MIFRLHDIFRCLVLLFLSLTTIATLSSLALRRTNLPSMASDEQSKYFTGPNRSPPPNFGKSGKIVGDINNDGFDDLIVGAYHDSLLNRQHSGSVYVIYGRPDGWEQVDINNLNGHTGFVIVGAHGNDLTGSAVGAADVNGDGFVDVIVGSTVSSPLVNGSPRYYAGATYIIYGKANQNATVDLLRLQASEGVKIIGANANDYSGSGVAGIGDFNDDGFEDVVIGAYYTTRNGRTNTGSAFIVFGRSDFGKEFDLAALTASSGFEAVGARAGASTGSAVSRAGDVNNDGIVDVIIGACFDGPRMEGVAYILFGKKQSSWTTVDLANLPSTVGIAIVGEVAGDNLGYSVSTAGDFNGDGIDDVVLGANFVEPGLFISNGGAAYVVFGSPSLTSIPSVGDLPLTQGFGIYGHGTNYNLGFVVSGGGDLDQDGYDDIMVGANQQSVDGVTFVGVVYVIAGKATSRIKTIDTNNFTKSDGYMILGSSQGELFGSSLSLGGDVNGDGYADLLIGAPNKNSGKGFTFLEFGRDWSPTAVPTLVPTVDPTASPTESPTVEPSVAPTVTPSMDPTESPSLYPSYEPTVEPTVEPSKEPTMKPSEVPSEAPTLTPTQEPTLFPSELPTEFPTSRPTAIPSIKATPNPTFQPTINTNDIVTLNMTLELRNVLTATLSTTGNELIIDGLAVVSGLPESNFGVPVILSSTEVIASFHHLKTSLQSSTWTLTVQLLIEAPLRFYPMYFNNTAALCSLLQANITLLNQVNPGNAFVSYIQSHSTDTFGPELRQMTLPPPPQQRVTVTNCTGVPKPLNTAETPTAAPTFAPSEGTQVRSNSQSNDPLIYGASLIAVIVVAIVVGLGLCCGCWYYLYVTGAIAALAGKKKGDKASNNGEDTKDMEMIIPTCLNDTQLESIEEGIPSRAISLESFMMDSFDHSDNRSIASLDESVTGDPWNEHRTSLSFL